MTVKSIIIVICYLLFVNGVSWLAFAIDKRRARMGKWRLSEAALLAWAAIGGSLGAIAARRVFRHKTRKEPFGSRLKRIVQGQLLLLMALTLVWLTNFRP